MWAANSEVKYICDVIGPLPVSLAASLAQLACSSPPEPATKINREFVCSSVSACYGFGSARIRNNLIRVINSDTDTILHFYTNLPSES